MAIATLRQAITALKTGNRAEARHLLQEIIRSNPADEKAWLWYIDTLASSAERIQALEWCLKFNPDSALARRGLNALRRNLQIAEPNPAYQQQEKRSAKPGKRVRNDNHWAEREPLFSVFVRPQWENREFYWYWDGLLFCDDCGNMLTQCTRCGAYFCVDCQSVRCILCGEPAIIESEEDEFPQDGFSIFKLVLAKGLEEDEIEYEEEYEEGFYEDRFDQEYVRADELYYDDE